MGPLPGPKPTDPSLHSSSQRTLGSSGSPDFVRPTRIGTLVKRVMARNPTDYSQRLSSVPSYHVHHLGPVLLQLRRPYARNRPEILDR